MDNSGNFSIELNNIFCSKCFDNSELSYKLFKNRIEDEIFDDILNILEEDNMVKLFDVIKNGYKLLAIDKTRNNYDPNNLCLIELQDHIICKKDVLVRYYAPNYHFLYLKCRKCFYYYMKLLPYLEELQNFKITLESLLCNVSQNFVFRLEFISYDNFTFHICKKNHLYELLTFISKVVEFSVPIEDIVMNVTTKSTGCKNAYSVIL